MATITMLDRTFTSFGLLYQVVRCGVEQKGFFQSVAWSAGGEALFVTVVPSGPWKYALLRFDLQGHVRVLHEGPQWCFDPRPSRDGHYLAFGLMNFDYNAWLIEGL